MLNFLSPPTDNFYKFIAIGGLLLFITCGVFIFSGMSKDDYKLTQAKGELIIQESKLKAVIDDLSYLPQYDSLENMNVSKLREWSNHITDTSYSNDPQLIQSFYLLPDSIRKQIQSFFLHTLKSKSSIIPLLSKSKKKRAIWILPSLLYILERYWLSWESGFGMTNYRNR